MSANDKQIGGRHYKGRKVQHWDYACQLPYLEGLATKYIDRHREKGGKEDLLKAIHTIEKMIEEYYSEAPQNAVPGTPNTGTAPTPNGQPAPSEGSVPASSGLCRHATNGLHSFSHVYKHDRAGKLYEILKCDWCQEEQIK